MKSTLKLLCAALMICTFNPGAKAQLFIINYFTGTTSFGSYGVNVTSSGSVSSGGALACLAPFTDQYWIGPAGIGQYTYTLSKPIYHFSVHAWGINGGALGLGEYMSMYVNGTYYPLTAANMLTYTECSAGGGPCYLWTGNLMGPVGSDFNYNGADFEIYDCNGINSFECWTDGILSGIAYSVYLDTTRPSICLHAINNSPCVNDTLWLDVIGDSTAATYLWSGPGGFTSTLRNPFLFPATFADSGVYTCIRTQGGFNDTCTTDVTIHPLPAVAASSNIPVCGLADSLLLSANPDSTGEVFSWTGPNGFASTQENPIIYPFDSVYGGTYTVNVISSYGCRNTASITIVPGIDPGFTFTRHFGCFFDTVYFTNTSVNATTYSWNFGDGSPTDINRNTYHVYSSHSMFNVTLSLTNAHCDTTITLPVDLRHSVTAVFTPEPDTVCLGQSITFADASIATLGYSFPALYSDTWRFGDGTTDNTFSPTHTYSGPGVYPVTLAVTDSIGCQDSITKNVYVLLLSLTSFNDTTVCIAEPMPLTNHLSVIPSIDLTYSFSWSSGLNLSDSTTQVPTFYGVGSFTYVLSASVVPYGCTVTDAITINSVLGIPLANVTPTTTISLGSSITLNADSEALYWWKPNDGSLSNPDINTPVATPSSTTLYTVYGYDIHGCLDSAFVEIIVDSTTEEGLPSAFTPNNDGKNDIFKPVGSKFQRLVEFRVYNRWGQEMFYSSNPNDGWDGTYGGVPQDIGTYYYTIVVAMPEGTNTTYKGSITLIR